MPNFFSPSEVVQIGIEIEKNGIEVEDLKDNEAPKIYLRCFFHSMII